MARRRNSNSEGGINLDSLMDALTNVVAVLILVLVLVQADVAQKVQKFLDDLEPASPEQIVAAKSALEEEQKRIQSLTSLMSEKAPTEEELEAEQRNLALLQQNLEQSEVKLKDLDQLRELEKKIRVERDREKSQTVAIQEEIAKLEALLDQTPAPEAVAPTVVNIPNSRPVPDDANIYHAMVIRDRVHIIEPDRILKIFEEEFQKNRKDWLVERVQQRGADRYIYDGQKIEKHFENFDWGDTRGQTIRVISPKQAIRVFVIIFPDLQNGGTAVADLATVGSNFSKAASKMTKDFKAVLLFRVHPDSFGTYLKARALIDKANIPAGWEVNEIPNFRVELPEDLEVVRLETPPTPTTPPTPAPPKPPPIGPKLD